MNYGVNYGHVTIQVPVLIGQKSLSCPLLGNNVIAETIKANREKRGELILLLYSEKL